jgi:hypothetical protein
MMSFKKIEFSFVNKANGERIKVGHIYWPRKIETIRYLADDVVEVVEKYGRRATFSLDDITLQDLWS